MQFNYAVLLEQLAQVLPQEWVALAHGDERLTYQQLNQRSNRLARFLLNNGVELGDHVGHYMRNSPRYIETFFGCTKSRAVHVNVNYRYKQAELQQLLSSLDVKVLVYDTEFADEVAEIRDQLPQLTLFIEAGCLGDAKNSFASSFSDIVGSGDCTNLGLDYSGEDLLIIATGGTTGLPKGTLWRQQDLMAVNGTLSAYAVLRFTGGHNPKTLEQHIANVEQIERQKAAMPLSPLMHGAGLSFALASLCQGSMVVTMPGERFDPAKTLQTIADHQVTMLMFVGDAFCSGLVAELEKPGNSALISSLRIALSSGAMWSAHNKKALLKHNPKLHLLDMLGSSEAMGTGSSVVNKDSDVETAKFQIGPRAKVITAEGEEVLAGDGRQGMLVIAGYHPLGYYKDEQKTQELFVELNGKRYLRTGDMATVDANGVVHLLGRDNKCINSGGEKIFVEEVEQALKAHASVYDALVVGLPDPKFGRVVTAVVQLRDGQQLDEDALKSFVRDQLADYKKPKYIFSIADIKRAPNGKADYDLIQRYAQQSFDQLHAIS